MPPLPQTAGRQSRFLCETELMIRAVNVVPTATRLDVAGGAGAIIYHQTFGLTNIIVVPFMSPLAKLKTMHLRRMPR